MNKLGLVVSLTALVTLGIPVHHAYTHQPKEKIVLDKVDKKVYPIGSFEHEHKKTI